MLREDTFWMMEDEDRFLEKLVRLYIAARNLMDGTAGPIRRLIDEGDVVYGVLPEAIKPHGIDLELSALPSLSFAHHAGVDPLTIMYRDRARQMEAMAKHLLAKERRC
jgi:hypothetical protein